MAVPRMIDLRSDTVTRPSPAMREAMARAEVGDDVYGEDPTVNALQERVAELLGKETALFVASGVMGNQIAIKVHTKAGEEIVVERDAHVFQYETAAPAVLSQVLVHTIPGTRGVMAAADVEAAIRPDVYYYPRTALICLENTHNKAGGTIYPLEEMKAIRKVADRHKIAVHLDGARLWNASVATGVPPRVFAELADTVSVCLSKGLGAPVGSVVAGPADLIRRGRAFRKVIGGGMRQAGILAAAGLYALEHHIDRLKEDHAHARLFAQSVAGLPGLRVDLQTVQTNIVMVDISSSGHTVEEILGLLKAEGVLLSDGGAQILRAVTHLDVTKEDVQKAIEVFKRIFR